MMRMIGNVVCFLLLAQLLAQFPASDGMKCYFGMETAGGGVPKTEVHCATTQCVTATSTCTDHDECRKRLKQVESKLHGIDAGTDLSGVKLLKKVIEKALVADGVRVRSFGCAEKCIPEVRKGLRVDYDCCRGALCNEGDEDDLIVEAVSHAHKADLLRCYLGNGTAKDIPKTEVECVSPAQCMTSTYTCTDREKCRKFGKEVEDSIRLGKVSPEGMEQTKTVVAIIDKLAVANVFYAFSCAAKCESIERNGLKRENECCSVDLCNYGGANATATSNASTKVTATFAPSASSAQMSASFAYAMMISSLVACLYQYLSILQNFPPFI